MLNPHIFRAYDVRGRIGADINPDVFVRVGRAYGTLLRRRGGRTIAVGQDNRLSSAELKAAFVAGVRRRRRRRRRHRAGHHPDPLLRHRPLASGRRRQHHGQPQPHRVQRREDGVGRRRAADRGRDPDSAPSSSTRGLRDRRRSVERPRSPRRLLRDGRAPRLAPAQAHRRGRCRQRRGRPLRPRASSPARLRGRRAALRVGRQLPQPPARSGRPGRTWWTCRPRFWRWAPTSAWPGTATPTGWGSSTSGAAATRPTSCSCCWPAISWPAAPARRSSST